LNVTSSPQNASVYVEDRGIFVLWGNTPLKVSLGVGVKNILVSKKAYRNYSTSVSILANRTTSLAVTLNPAEDCEAAGDEDGDGLANCADASDCPEKTFCNPEHTLVCNSVGSCMPRENCSASGDEDGDGLSDCADVRDCQSGLFCGIPEYNYNKWCDSSRAACVFTPAVKVWERVLSREIPLPYRFMLYAPDCRSLSQGSP
jgi:hypothetical protein